MANLLPLLLGALLLIGGSVRAAPITTTAAVADHVAHEEANSEETQLAEISVASQASEGDANYGFKLNLLPIPEKTAESVNLEKEGIPSKILGVYDNSQQKLLDVSHPVPILDSVSENEKYGNHGDKFDGITRGIVNGYEAFSNLLNTLIEKPKEIARSISKGITAQLDVIGGKLVGL